MGKNCRKRNESCRELKLVEEVVREDVDMCGRRERECERGKSGSKSDWQAGRAIRMWALLRFGAASAVLFAPAGPEMVREPQVMDGRSMTNRKGY